MFCCDEFGKLLEMGYIFRADESYLMYAYRGAEKRVLKIRFCPFCGEGEIGPWEEEFWRKLDESANS